MVFKSDVQFLELKASISLWLVAQTERHNRELLAND